MGPPGGKPDVDGREPEFFIKTPQGAVGPTDRIRLDRKVTRKLDYETELAIVIGKPGRHIAKKDAFKHVFGYLVMNDVTARDRKVRMRPDGSCTYALGPGKNFDSCALPRIRKLFLSSKDYCDEVVGLLSAEGLEVTELSTHLQGQLVAVHPAYDEAFDGFAAPEVRGNPVARQAWAVEQVMLAAKARRHAISGCPTMRPFLGRWFGPSCIRGPNARPD